MTARDVPKIIKRPTSPSRKTAALAVMRTLVPVVALGVIVMVPAENIGVIWERRRWIIDYRQRSPVYVGDARSLLLWHELVEAPHDIDRLRVMNFTELRFQIRRCHLHSEIGFVL